MNRFYFLFLSILIILFVSQIIFFSKTVNASPLIWKHSYGDALNVSVIVASKQNQNKIYASVVKNGDFDLLKSQDSGNSWNSIKSNLPYGSDINYISIYNKNDSIIAVSLWYAGVFMSENSGTYWSKISSYYFPRAVAISPITNEIIFIGIGGNNDSNSGIYKSIDKGFSWTKITTLGSLNNSQINIDRFNPLRLFADIGGPLYRSDDGGNTWTKLPLFNAYSSNTLVDTQYSNILFTGRYDIDEGVYKSTDNGDSWKWQTNGPIGKITRLAQDSNGILYVTRVGNGGGIWKSTDRGTTWENISDPLWGDGQNVDTVDIAGEKIFVGVEYKGIFWAYTNGDPPDEPPTPTHLACQNNTCIEVNGAGSDICQSDANCAPPPPLTHMICQNFACVKVDGTGSDSCQTSYDCRPNPVIFIPGFSGSWSHKGLIENQPTTYSDWKLIPIFSDDAYQPLINTLQNTGLKQDINLFTFAYDYRQSVADSASWLNSYLSNKVTPQNPGLKTNIVAHSMGGLIARYCFEKINGCADKINKIVTAGSPHQGVLEAYQAWEGGQFNETNPVLRAAEEAAIRVFDPLYLTRKDIIQHKFLGVSNMLPTFDYILGKPYVTLSSKAKNPLLESLNPTSTNFTSSLLAFSGSNLQTPSQFVVTSPNPVEKILGLWIDGKPTKINTAIGDSTVLQLSSAVGGATNQNFPLDHKNYLNTSDSLQAVLDWFGLSGKIDTSVNHIHSVMVLILHSPATFKLTDGFGNPVGAKADDQTIFVENPSGNFNLTLTGTSGGKYQLDTLFSDGNNVLTKMLFGKINDQQIKTLQLYLGSSGPTFISPSGNNIYLDSFLLAMADLDKKYQNNIGTTIKLLLINAKNATTRQVAINGLVGYYYILISDLNGQSDPVVRSKIMTASEELLNLATYMNQQYGSQPAENLVNQVMTTAKQILAVGENFKSPKVSQAANCLFVEDQLNLAKQELVSGDNFSALLRARSVPLIVL